MRYLSQIRPWIDQPVRLEIDKRQPNSLFPVKKTVLKSFYSTLVAFNLSADCEFAANLCFQFEALRDPHFSDVILAFGGWLREIFLRVYHKRAENGYIGRELSFVFNLGEFQFLGYGGFGNDHCKKSWLDL